MKTKYNGQRDLCEQRRLCERRRSGEMEAMERHVRKEDQAEERYWRLVARVEVVVIVVRGQRRGDPLNCS